LNLQFNIQILMKTGDLSWMP